METLEELVAQRRGYKFLKVGGVSPYQSFKYDLKNKGMLVSNVDTNLSRDCGAGWNLATLQWIADNCLTIDGVIVECAIPKRAQIIVPHNSDGKFRTDRIKFKKIHTVYTLFPALKDIQERLNKYKPVNPIIAEKLPSELKIKKIMSAVGDQVRAQVWDQVGDQVRAQVRAQVWAQVWDQVWDQVRDQVRAQVGDQVWDQVWDQVRVCGYLALKEFMNLDYDHPAFDLVRLGIIVIYVDGKHKVFGKNGKYLGEI